MTRLRRFFIAAVLAQLIPAGALRCQVASAGTAPAPRGGFVIAPVAYYSPETRLAWGIVGIHYFRLGDSSMSSRLSHYRFNLIRTQNKQSIAEINYELYLPGGRFLLDGQVKFSIYPDRFFGIGNRSPESAREDFNSRNWRLQLNLQRRWGEKIYAGLHLEFYSLHMLETQSISGLSAGEFAGSNGGNLSGLGVFVKWDSRDNTFSTRTGSYYTLSLNRYSRALGSDFSFGQFSLDARRYLPLGKSPVLAMQAVFKSAWGDCPFQVLPMFGGLNLLRGYYEGRYRDRNMLALQAEYRLPLWGRFGLCAFAGAAQVQEKASLLALNGFHPAGGAGLRYKFNQKENLNIRLDVGFAGSSPAFYLTFAEAF
jgi:outer membrane protein assembly factor BamA